MPARVHALLVVRPDGRTPAAHHLRRTLAALAEQTQPVDALTIVVCGPDPLALEAAREAEGAALVMASGATGFAAALELCHVDERADAVWLLAQDTAPDRDALARLAGTLELAPSAAFVAPKLVRVDDRSVIASLGVGMTRFGRAVGLADDEHDQGQNDAADDVIGADVRGLLVRAAAWRELGGLDPALAGADEGLDLGVRARLAGGRVSLVPAAVITVAGDGVAGLPTPATAARRRRISYASRTAQLHRRLAYAPGWAVPLHWLSLLPLALWRTLLHLVRKQPALIGPEWAASAVALVRIVPVGRARRRIARARRATWTQLRPLRVTGSQLRQRLDDPSDAGGGRIRPDLHFFGGGGAWLVLGALLVSVAAFPALLAWPVLGGGGLQPLATTVAQLWADTMYGSRALGLDTVGPADPFAVIVALLGTLSPLAPSRALVVLWLLALPLAAFGGWFAATRITERPFLRIVAGIVWALAPTLLVALTQGRPAAVVAHLLLPWLFYAASVAHRSWSAAGAASLLLAAVVACAPSLAPALVVIWVGVIVLAVAVRRGRGVARLIWLVVPALALAGPFAWRALRTGDGWWMLADPGVTAQGAQAGTDAAGRALLAAGLPTPDLAGWATLLAGLPTWWVPLLAAPLALLALVAPLTPRWAAGIVLLVVTVLGAGTAFGAVGLSVAFAQSLPVALWPGAGLSLAWLGALGGALVALDAGLAPRWTLARVGAGAVVLVGVVVLAVPALTALARDEGAASGVALLQNGPESTLPAYVAAAGAGDSSVGTLVLTPQNAGGVSARVVWGGSETLGGQSTIVSTRTAPTPGDDRVAALAADLMTGAAGDAVAALAGDGIRFLLLAPAPAPESDAARAARVTASSSIDQRSGLDAVGDTSKGVLWRVTAAVEPRTADAVPMGATIAVVQGIVMVIALLLALPTAAARRAARRTPRIVGPHGEETR